jgi:hypothetical protein
MFKLNVKVFKFKTSLGKARTALNIYILEQLICHVKAIRFLPSTPVGGFPLQLVEMQLRIDYQFLWDVNSNGATHTKPSLRVG